MAITYAKAPAKVILFGEHAVVYGQPAIAMPVTRVNATARILPLIDAPQGQIQVQAPDIQLDKKLTDLPEDHPLAAAIRLTLTAIAPVHLPSLSVQISSTIPVAAGMGSSAATSVAIIHALSNFFGAHLSSEQISDLAFEVEKLHHGTPSGIDNNVIAHQQPVYFVKDQPIEFLKINNPTHWIIADTGEKTPTREAVAGVRERYQADPAAYSPILSAIGEITRQAREPLASGDLALLGPLLNENQDQLRMLGVSCGSLDALIAAALQAGAFGAKLSGGGLGGNIISLANPEIAQSIAAALVQAGARHVITTILQANELS
jgi:mevalonate kinase